MLVSFIIPAYNAADTIERCLNSIYALSLKREEFEVIVIDDASTDNTCEIIEQYVRDVLCMMSDASKSNMTLLKQPKNHRQGAARNRGVKIAQGEYICFVDADDAVTEGVVEAIWIAKDKQTDMTVLRYSYANPKGEIAPVGESLSFDEEQIFTGVEMQNRYPYWCSAPWGYLYGKEFLDCVNNPFAEDVLYEDSDFVATHLYYAKRMAYSKTIGYVTYYREGSTTRSTNYKNVADYLLLGTRMLVLYENVTSENMNEDVARFAEGILEGACWNVQKSVKRMIRLNTIREIKAYYQRIDCYVNRMEIVLDTRLHKYYWNTWTTIFLRYKSVSIIILSILSPMYRLIKSIM